MYRSASTIAPARSGGRIVRSSRSAKSAAWIRLNVRGLSNRLALPYLVVSRTSGEEFHSLKYAQYPIEVIHLRSKSSCVLLPDPSMPSTTNSLPGNSPRSAYWELELMAGGVSGSIGGSEGLPRIVVRAPHVQVGFQP